MKLYKNFISFLRWSERYTKTDMGTQFKGSWLTLTQIIASLSGFVLLIFCKQADTRNIRRISFSATGFTLVCVIALPGENCVERVRPEGLHWYLTLLTMFRTA